MSLILNARLNSITSDLGEILVDTIQGGANVGLTADVGSGQGDGVITSSYNVYSVVGTAGDAATLPATSIVGQLVYIKNDDSTESMDVFPASGDDAGAGTDTAVAVAAGESKTFMCTVADATWTELIVDTGGGGGGDVTKVGTPVDNQIGVWTGDGTLEGDTELTYVSGTELNVTTHIVVPQTNEAATPTLEFGTTNTGIYAPVANVLSISNAGVQKWSFTADRIQSAGAGAAITFAAPAVTTPSLLTSVGDLDTGIGGTADVITVVAGAVEAVRYTEVSSAILQAHEANVGLTADVGSAQGNGVITSSYNTYTVVGTAGDAATLPATAPVGTIVYVKNDDSAESMDVFPASGDTILPNAVNIAEAVAAGESAAFLCTVANATWTKFIVGAAGGGGGDVTKVGTPVDNEIGVWTGDGTIEGTTELTFDGSSFAAYGGDVPSTHHFGIDAANNFNFEVGSNYVVLSLEDDNVSTELQFMYFDLNSASTGAKQFQWMDEGSATVIWDIEEGTYLFGGGIELTEQSDHSGTVAGGRGQIWVKSNSFGGELYYTEGDSDDDFSVQNVAELTYIWNNSVASSDPGAGTLRYDNATPASVTELFIDDLENTGRDAAFMLSNLAVGDIITMRNVSDEDDYFVASVDGATTDNTGWWTVPVAPIHVGTLPISGTIMHITVEWAGSQGGGGGVANPLEADIDGDGFNLDDMGVIFMREQSGADADVTGAGQLWVRDEGFTQTLMFTADNGNDIELAAINLTDMNSSAISIPSTSFVECLVFQPDVNQDYMVTSVFEVNAPSADDIDVEMVIDTNAVFKGVLQYSNQDGSVTGSFALDSGTGEVITNIVSVPTEGNTTPEGTYVTSTGCLRMGATSGTHYVRVAKILVA